jgi:hypothetical protein
MEWWTSMAGIVAASIACGEAIKRYLADVEGLNAVPLVLYVMACNLVLTAIAWGVMGAFPDDDPWHLLVRVVTTSMASVGGVGIATNLTKPLRVTGHKP